MAARTMRRVYHVSYGDLGQTTLVVYRDDVKVHTHHLRHLYWLCIFARLLQARACQQRATTVPYGHGWSCATW